MSQLFSLDAHRCGNEHHTTAEADGIGVTVYLDGNPVNARTYERAVRVATEYVGKILEPAERREMPWGLRVTVPDGVAVYGQWPLVPGGGGSPDFRNTPLVKIRNRWHDSGPLSALRNAEQILREYRPAHSQRRAA